MPLRFMPGYAIYRWNLATRRRELVFAQPGLWSIADYRPDGRLLLRKSTGSLSSEYSEWNPATRVLKPLLGQGETVEYTAVYGARAGQLVVLTPKFGDFRRLYSFAIGQPITLVFDPFEIAAITLSVLATVIVVVDGESNWVEGLQLVSIYAILALAFYFVPAAAG